MEKEEINALRKGKAKVPEEPPLQAVVLADSFSTNFRPITLERPKVLLPLVGVPMIDYTLTWLESEGIQEVFVFLPARSPQVIEYLNSSKWNNRPNFTVKTIESHNSIDPGRALRDVIHGDFVLVSGDLVSNMPLAGAILEHKRSRERDNNAVMTMVVESNPSSSDTNGITLGVDFYTDQLLWYKDSDDHLYGALPAENEFIVHRMRLHYDLQDCYTDIRSPRFTDNFDYQSQRPHFPHLSEHCHIDICSPRFTENFDYSRQRRHFSEDCYVAICSPEVLLPLFSVDFDYPDQHLHFVKGLLADGNRGYKIYTFEMDSSYVARIVNYRSYDAISNAIMGWEMSRYASELFVDFSKTVGDKTIRHVTDTEDWVYYISGVSTVVGKGTTIGYNTNISDSFIGNGCKIGLHVTIKDCYIWNDVTIEDCCELRDSIVCDGVIIKYGAVLKHAVLSFKVVVGYEFSVPAYSKVSLLQQPDRWCPSSQLGEGGHGYIHGSTIDDLEDDDSRDDTFEEEVEATFQRAVDENIKVGDIILEIKLLRLSWNQTSMDFIFAGALFFAVMKRGLENARAGNGELQNNVANIITKWRVLLQHYGNEIDAQIEMILKFEEMCQESATAEEFSPIFTDVLYFLYDKEVIQEEAILTWADEKRDADESDRVFVTQAQELIQWLMYASEEED